MTIAVCAAFPWGPFRRIAARLPQGLVQDGIILASDSRWTYDDRPPDDMGQKLWPLAPQRGLGAVFAGDVRAAADGLRRAQHYLHSAPCDVATEARLISESLASAYEQHSRDARIGRRPRLGRLAVLVGKADQTGQNFVLTFDSSSGFVPGFRVGVQAIGWPSARETLLKKISEQDAAFFTQPGTVWQLDIGEWALRLVATLFCDVVEPGNEPTVGGAVQIATITPQAGWREPKIERTTGLGPTLSWEEISGSSESRKRWGDRFSAPPLAAGSLDFGVINLLDDSAPTAAADVAAPTKAKARR